MTSLLHVISWLEKDAHHTYVTLASLKIAREPHARPQPIILTRNRLISYEPIASFLAPVETPTRIMPTKTELLYLLFLEHLRSSHPGFVQFSGDASLSYYLTESHIQPGHALWSSQFLQIADSYTFRFLAYSSPLGLTENSTIFTRILT